MKIAVLMMLGALLAGCAARSLRPGADDPARVTNNINLSGFPSEYRHGFSAGCESSKEASGRSPRRPKGEASFVQGWQDGFDYCRPTKAR